MNNQKVELDIYQECLYEINKRIDVINDHLDGVINEKLLRERLHNLCGGKLEITSQIGKGTVCKITLPKGENL